MKAPLHQLSESALRWLRENRVCSLLFDTWGLLPSEKCFILEGPASKDVLFQPKILAAVEPTAKSPLPAAHCDELTNVVSEAPASEMCSVEASDDSTSL